MNDPSKVWHGEQDRKWPLAERPLLNTKNRETDVRERGRWQSHHNQLPPYSWFGY